ncbi:MAG TPA: glycosyltransferase [Acidimicrobiales bacterium]|nr:glycosyltransferase [Acidimicrobiales bacterium]
MAAVSVVIPSFNNRRYVTAAIDSVLGQTFQHLQLLVIDDGSTDGSAEVIANHLDVLGDPRVRLAKIEHQGLVAALNMGLANARDEYFTFLGSDDTWMPTKLERQVRALQSVPAAAACFSDCWIIDQDGRRQYRLGRAQTRPYHGGRIFSDLWSMNFMPQSSTYLFRTDAVREVGGFDPDIEVEDVPLWLRLAHRYEVVYLDELLANHRVHGDHTLSNDLPLNRRSILMAHEKMTLLDPSLILNRRLLDLRSHEREAYSHYQCFRLRLARAHALAALRIDPRSRHAWRVLYRSLLGRRLIGHLRELRSKLH